LAAALLDTCKEYHAYRKSIQFKFKNERRD